MIKLLAFSLLLLALASEAFYIQNMPLEQQILLRNRIMQANNGQVNMLSGDYEQRLPILLKRAYKKYGGKKSYEELLEEYIKRVLGSSSYLISNDNDNDDYLKEFRSRILNKVYQENYGSTEYESYPNAKYDRDDKKKRYRPKHVIFIDDDNMEYKKNADNDEYKPASPYRSPMTASYGDNEKKERKGYADNYKSVSTYKPSKYGDEKDERKGYAEKDDEDDKYAFVSRKGKYGSDNDEDKKESSEEYQEEKKYSDNDDDERRSYRKKPSKRVKPKYKPRYEADEDRKYNFVSKKQKYDSDEDEDEDEDRDEKENYDKNEEDNDKSEEEDKNEEKDDDDDIRKRHKPSPYEDISDAYLANGLDSVTYDLDRRIRDNFGYPAYAPFYVGAEWINEHVVPFYKSLIKYSKDARKIQKYKPDME